MGDSDIRRWFLKQPHGKNTNATTETETDKEKETLESRPDLKKTSKYFSSSAKAAKPDPETAKPTPEKTPAKRKLPAPTKTSPSPKKAQESKPKESCSPSPNKRPRAVEKQSAAKAREETPDEDDFEDVVETPVAKSGGRGRGRGNSSASPAEDKKPTPAGRGRGGGGGGRGAFFAQPRQVPPHKGEKEIPEGADDCLSGRTFVISGTLDSLEREEAEDLIKRHGGRITTSVSKKTSYLLADEDVGGRKSQKAKELGVPFITEDGLLDIIRSSKPKKSSEKPLEVKSTKHSELTSKSPAPKANFAAQDITKSTGAPKGKPATLPSNESKTKGVAETEAWPQKYRPKNTTEIVGNQSIVKQLHDWLQQWHAQNLHGQDQKGKKRGADNNSKKAVLMSGPPGIGKTTSARLISKMLGFEPFEVNASDSRGKADSKVVKGISGSTSNAIKEMVSNESLAIGNNSSKQRKPVLIMDEVDGMSGGDRGGVADLIASIKVSKIPIICICNDRYSQKLKSLVNYCLPLNYRKPTKQQMAKRLQQIATSEGMQVDEIALEELAERVNGDMRMALNQLQYMSLHSRVIKFNDVKARLGSSAKDEDMSPFNAVDRLMSYDGGRLRMDERMDASMSDPDLVPLLIQENYVNYCPAIAGRDDNGTARLDKIAMAAASIADGDIVNAQIRQYRQWQHSQMAAFMSSIIPASIMHGRRETLLPGERNFNRFGGWLGKNSSYGKKMRQLDDVHVHLLASRVCEPTRQALRRDYLYVLALQLTTPLKDLPKEKAVPAVVELMETYSLTQEDIESILEIIKFQGQPDPMAGVPPAVKSALTKAYKQMENERKVRSADLLPVFNPTGQKKLPKKRTKLEITLADTDADAEAEELEESLDSDEDETNSNDQLAALESNSRIQLTLKEEKPKAGAKKGKASQAQTSTKRPAKETNNSKPAKRSKKG